MASRRLKNITKAGMRLLFEQGQRLGIDILPRHFYSEIPDIRALRREQAWKAPFSMTGVEGADVETQLEFVQRHCPPVLVEHLRMARVHRAASHLNEEEGYGPAEADFLFAYVASARPRQIFQIGCGVSTAICLLAAEHAGYEPTIVCVEPYPTEFLRSEEERGRIDLIRKKVQQIDYAAIEDLGDDLLFFVDSTHTLGPAGEVSRIILEMLPRLKPGVMVHFHDIRFPYDYPRRTLDGELFFSHESVLLHAFLVHNARFRIAASLSMLHYATAERLQAYLPSYRPAGNDEGLNVGEGHFPSATYIEVVA